MAVVLLEKKKKTVMGGGGGIQLGLKPLNVSALKQYHIKGFNKD